MIFIRIIAIALPQLLLLMLAAAALDLLGNWNHTDAGFGTLILLFLLNPVVAVIFLVTELVRYRLQGAKGHTSPSFLMPAIAIVIFVEVFATNLYLLSQVKM